MNGMTWLDVGWHFDLLVIGAIVLPVFLACVVIAWHDGIEARRDERSFERELNEWREKGEERAYRKRLRNGV